MLDIEQGLIKEEQIKPIDVEPLPTAVIITTAQPYSLQSVTPIDMTINRTIRSSQPNLSLSLTSSYRSKNECCCDIANCGQKEMVGIGVIFFFTVFIIFICNYITVPPRN